MALTHIIKFHEANQRLDHFLMKQSFATKEHLSSRSECTVAINNGLILLNNAPAKPSSVLKTGDVITFTGLIHHKNTSVIANPNISIDILFQNQHFLIIDKPAGIAMHGSTFDDTKTVTSWLVAHYPDIVTIGEDALRPGIVHRLDKDTSGVCVIAKTNESFIALKELFKKHSIQKTYTAIVHGHIVPKEGIINTAIARSLTLRKQAVVDANLMVRGKIRDAITSYTVTQSLGDFDIVEAQPKTGRMHQIRVHLFSIGHPIVGDKLYSTKLTRKADRERIGGSIRQLLHAKRLQFSLFGEDYDFSSPLPADFTQFLDAIK